ncbi:hypothetical protein DMENIID0001_168120 [Sergentomyia squamirostris]
MEPNTLVVTINRQNEKGGNHPAMVRILPEDHEVRGSIQVRGAHEPYAAPGEMKFAELPETAGGKGVYVWMVFGSSGQREEHCGVDTRARKGEGERVIK